jgi:hypothetical protein
LNARAATKRDNRLIALDGFSQILNELILALALNRDLLNLHGIAVKLTSHAHGVAGDPDFTLSSREAHGDTGAATNKKNFLVPRDDVDEFRNGLGMRQSWRSAFLLL